MTRKRKTRAEWIDERLEELGLTQGQFVAQLGLSRETFRRVRIGKGSHPKTILHIEAALSWAEGSIAAIDKGKEPRVVDVAAIAARPLPAHLAPDAPAADDFPALLRYARQKMGPANFWREIGAMQAEEDSAGSDRPHATG